MKITWLYIELSGNKLKIIWNQIESKLKSIESKLKSNWNHLKVIWNYDSTNYSDPLTSKLTSLKSTPQMLGGGAAPTLIRIQHYWTQCWPAPAANRDMLTSSPKDFRVNWDMEFAMAKCINLGHRAWGCSRSNGLKR